MNLFSFFLPPILLALSVPFALFAALTTVLALSALTFRAMVVYIELAVVVTHNYLFVHPQSSPSSRRNRSASTTSVSHRRKKRRSSGSSATSDQALMGGESGGFTLAISVGLERDFEGVGGWSLSAPNEDALWTSMNSRLELPAGERERWHRRSLTASGIPSGSADNKWKAEWRYTAEGIGLSPLMSRARTPPATAFPPAGSQEGYFNFQPMTRMKHSGESAGKSRSPGLHCTPPSSSTASSGSSGRTAHLTMESTS